LRYTFAIIQKENIMPTTTYRIHPAIGVARLGDSPDDYFIGPEAPYVLPTLSKPDAPPSATDGTHRDAQGHIKRQGQRFRIYQYRFDDNGALQGVREITSADAEIEWQVHLTNRKAASVAFGGDHRRNEDKEEGALVIDARAQTISGVSQPLQRLAGHFMDLKEPVALGDILTDRAGRLIVLGGFGKSESSPPGVPLDDYANNDNWHDDTSDGPVYATVRIHGAMETVDADSAWVLCAPPKFAPELVNVITLDDVVYDMMAQLDPTLAVTANTEISFTRDIYPILKRASNMHWVSDISRIRHSPGRPGHFVSRLAELSSNAPEHQPAREFIFKKLRNPQGGGGNMPKLPAAAERGLVVSLTQVQYDKMRRWAEGTFIADWLGEEPTPVPLEQLPVAEQPRALDRAILLTTVGAGRYPGIEAGNVMLEPGTYDVKRPFRINTGLPPGWLSARMALPWQADFRDCAYEEDLGLDWWPGQRPNDVWRMVGTELKREKWVPETEEWEGDNTRRPMMVKHWSELGFILKKQIDGTAQFVEAERTLKE
jgi:hypothetical protein